MDRRPHRDEVLGEAGVARLADWYVRGRRDLPWRRTRDPYRIWLSETMLQQTRVDTVVPYYERFLARFPTLDALAAADEEDVLRLWAGLGYYARARNLKRAAEAVAREHGGELPREAEALASLPGVGRYTVGALRSIAFGERAALVDGNVRRVLSRLAGRRELADEDAWRLAEALVPAQEPGEWNQALMELGATVCTPRKPACLVCPVADFCAARGSDPERFPAPRKKTPVRRVHAVAGVLARRGRILIVRRPSHGLLGGLWELPTAEGTDAAALVAAVRERSGLAAAPGPGLGQVRHLFTHRDLRLELYGLEDRGGRLARRPDARFCGPAELEALPLSRLMKKALALARPM
jgi:A/G-specific adenine glycosylase